MSGQASKQSQYAAAASVPLIKSPSLRVPKQVELPPDIHPLPESVTPYFVYPFAVEAHVLSMESARRSTLAAHAARREAYLRAREEELEQRKRDALRRIAPGFEPQGVLIPTKRSSVISVNGGASNVSEPGSQPARSVMDDLVEQLALLDSQHKRE